MKDDKSIFNFKEEILKPDTYRELFPEEREGLVIVHLYEGVINKVYENGRFSGEEIHRLFESTMTTREKETHYVRAYNKERILRLQKYFLNYDEETRTYSFQEYGLNLCKIVKATLEGSFKPTKIKVICSELKNQLNNALYSEDLIREWLEVHFEHYHPTLKQHIDFLDRQIDESVSKLRKDTLAQHLEPLELLRTVNDDLTEIQNKNKELRSAFTETNSINLILTQIDSENSAILGLIDSKVYFFDSIQSRLRGTDRRLNRIQPKIKQLFAAFRNPEYSAQTDRFIRFLLKYSELIRQEGTGEKRVIFPKEVREVTTRFKRPKYIHFDRDKELFPIRSKQRKKYTRDIKAEKESKAILDKAFNDSETIDNWVNLIFAELRKNKEINISELFYRVLRDTSDFTIATKVYFEVIDMGHERDDCTIKINKSNLIRKEGLILWSTVLQEH
ncbi:MAG: hypothetical protein QNJ57_00760 [Flavobacteriaceae bacterium]|nr:hypothetical protein [Flavobacteriaceae bacterium]